MPIVPTLYCKKRQRRALSAPRSCAVQPARQLRGIGRVLGAAAAEVHPVGVVVVVQRLHPLVPVHVALAVTQLCRGEGSRLELPQAGAGGGGGRAVLYGAPPRAAHPVPAPYLRRCGAGTGR